VTTTDSVPATQADVRLLSISAIREDGQTQHRVALDPSIIAEYASLMREGVTFPPVRVWWDGGYYWLSDGFQRVAAAESADHTQIAAEVLQGTLSDAQWDSYAANAAHGLRRTMAETQAVIERALGHPTAAHLSNVQIAKHLHLPESTVRRWRTVLSSPRGEDGVRIVTRGEITYALNTRNLGKKGGERRASHHRNLRAELEEMKGKGSPTVRPLLNIFGHWALGQSTSTECLEAIEKFMRRCHTPDEPVGAAPLQTDALAAREESIADDGVSLRGVNQTSRRSSRVSAGPAQPIKEIS
jgi:hypothetical protein